MNREDIIRMAREAEMAEPTEFLYNNYWTASQAELERFAALVAAAEREACLEMVGILVEAEREECAKVCDQMDHDGVMIAADCAAAIRARGQA